MSEFAVEDTKTEKQSPEVSESLPGPATERGAQDGLGASQEQHLQVGVAGTGREHGSPRPVRACTFFLQGRCIKGVECRFSHDIPQVAGGFNMIGGPVVSGGHQPIQQGQQMPGVYQSGFQPRGYPAPMFVDLPPGAAIYSIDVECIATGTHHNARAVAQVALVDEWARPICNIFIKPDVPIVSYLTPLTGITKEMIDKYGSPIADALVALR